LKNFCTKCGSRISSKNRFCENCGAPLSAGLSPEELNSVMVKKLESGEIVFYRPPSCQPTQTKTHTSLPNHKPDIKDESIYGEIQTDTILPVVDTPILIKTREEITPAETPVLEKPAAAAEDIFSPLPLMEEFMLLEADCFTTEHFEPKSEDTVPAPTDISDFEKPEQPLEMYFSPDPTQDKVKSDSDSKPMSDNQVDESVRRFLNDEPLSDQKNDSISFIGWVGIIFLLMIPVINLLLTIIWALGGCRKKQKARFARALLVSLLIIALLVFISLTLLKDYINTAINNLFSGGGTPSELALRLLEGVLGTAKSWGLDLRSLFPLM